MTKQLNDYEIMKVVEGIETIIAKNLKDDDTYVISEKDIPELSDLADREIDFGQICLYAMHEVITINADAEASKHKLFINFQYLNGNFTAVIN